MRMHCTVHLQQFSSIGLNAECALKIIGASYLQSTVKLASDTARAFSKSFGIRQHQDCSKRSSLFVNPYHIEECDFLQRCWHFTFIFHKGDSVHVSAYRKLRLFVQTDHLQNPVYW